MSASSITAALATAVLAAALLACAARGPSKLTSAPGAADAGSDPALTGRPADLRARIAELDDAIARDLDAAAVERPDAAAAAAAAATPMAEVRRTCPHVPSDRCTDLCRLSASICDAAAQICDLAAELPGDAWAEERCAAAKAACARASERCCAGACAPPPLP